MLAAGAAVASDVALIAAGLAGQSDATTAAATAASIAAGNAAAYLGFSQVIAANATVDLGNPAILAQIVAPTGLSGDAATRVVAAMASTNGQMKAASTLAALNTIQTGAQGALAKALGTSVRTTINGMPGDDGFVDAAGNQIYVGNGGRDVLTIPEGRRGAALSLLSNGDVAIDHAGQSDAVRGVAAIRFIDGRMAFDPADPAAQVTRLYQAALGRLPDQGGLNFWIARIGSNVPLTALANGFLATPEFITRFGSGQTNTAFVTAIYQNVLGRAPDQGGLDFFVGSIDSKAASRADVLVAISESTENKTGTAGLVAAGIWDVSESAQQVARLYDTALGRLPDQGGLDFWTKAIDTGTGTLQDLAAAFVSSKEFVATYGILDNRAFVQAVYGNTLGRTGDAGGVDFWTGRLDSGSTRATITIGFSESSEHIGKAAAVTGGEAAATFGINLG